MLLACDSPLANSECELVNFYTSFSFYIYKFRTPSKQLIMDPPIEGWPTNRANLPAVQLPASNSQVIMDSSIEGWPNNRANPLAVQLPASNSQDMHEIGMKRERSPAEVNLHAIAATVDRTDVHLQKRTKDRGSNTIDYSNPRAVPRLMERLDGGQFGSVSKDIKELLERRRVVLNSYFVQHPTILEVEQNRGTGAQSVNQAGTLSTPHEVIDLDDDDEGGDGKNVENDGSADKRAMVVIDLDDDNAGDVRPPAPYQEVVLNRPVGEYLMKDFLAGTNCPKVQTQRTPRVHSTPRSRQNQKTQKEKVKIEEETFAEQNEGERVNEGVSAADESGRERDKGQYVGVEDEEEAEEVNDQPDGLDDIWKEMNFALECSKDAAEAPPDEPAKGPIDMCDHSFVLKDDIGYVCRVCGVIQKGIEEIIEYQYAKSSRTARTYFNESKSAKERDVSDISHDGVRSSGQEFTITEISAHPMHWKQMKPHQIEGFNFLLSNLVSEDPGGCILAHAPGSGKTFMIISFMQSFLAKYPQARPLVVLPRGILSTWKREFQRWQVEDIPLLDFYSVKAENRVQQLEVLQKWASKRSILFLGYKQFSTIVCDNENSKAATHCQEILLTYPSILVLDEGHTPRNEETDVLNSLKKVQTPRKIVLSGTLYQNHVKEVFNILDLVRPRFLKKDSSRAIMKRIMSRVPSARKNFKSKGTEVFYESVEQTLQKEDNFRMKVTVIQDLREMTSKVLHFYKGDFLDELPGLVDFTVFLNLTPQQSNEIHGLKSSNRKFKISSDGSALYVHPKLREYVKGSGKEREAVDDSKMDQVLENLNINDGVKAKFFLNMLSLCESSGEKLLVFSPYLQPLKFLERLTVKMKGWGLGREIFVITGDSNSETREWSMDRFNNSPDARVFFGSIKACGEGISLVGASRIIILDVHLNPSVTRQAIGRAFRPGQQKKVYVYRLVAAKTPEEEDHSTCFRKESIAKMWFEWNEYCGQQAFEMETVEVYECGDQFLETPRLREDVVALYKRQTMT